MNGAYARSLSYLAITIMSVLCTPASAVTSADHRPNILWIIAEDHSPMLGAYGDAYADTPTLDGLAKKGVAFTNAYSNAPVCAPARDTLITGLYAPSAGGHNHDNSSLQPAALPFVSRYLKEAGYWTANIGKYHYNLYTPTPMDAWDQKTEKTGWWDTAAYKAANKQGRKPFFTLLHLYYSHESQTSLDGWYRSEGPKKERLRGHTKHDPAKAPVPPYYPDTPTVREDIAQYYDNITRVDSEVKKVLQQLKDEGWADDTIVFYFSDHGNGIPRGKRWLYDSGLKVAMIAYVPEKYRNLMPMTPGLKSDRLVGFVDMAPTVLKLAGLPVPSYMEGHAFMGQKPDAEPAYVYGHRDRTDERFETIRAVRDKRYKYIRNYMPHLPYAQHLDYVYQVSAIMRDWQRLHDEGKLNPTQDAFFKTKPAEELYDTATDPHEVRNLAADPRYRPTLERMRKAQTAWAIDVRDLGLIPEGELQRLANGKPYYDVTRTDDVYPVQAVAAAAQLATFGKKESLPRLLRLMQDKNGIVRYWSAMGVLTLGDAGRAARPQLARLMTDEVPNVRIAAAHALCALGDCKDALPVLASALTHGWPAARLAAANALDYLDDKAKPVAPQMRAAYQTALKQSDDEADDFDSLYVKDNQKALEYSYAQVMSWALKKALADLDH